MTTPRMPASAALTEGFKTHALVRCQRASNPNPAKATKGMAPEVRYLGSKKCDVITMAGTADIASQTRKKRRDRLSGESHASGNTSHKVIPTSAKLKTANIHIGSDFVNSR